MLYNRLLPLIIPLVSGLMLILLSYKANLIYVLIISILLLQFFIARQFCVAAKKKEKWWNIAILPSVFTVSLIGFSVLIPSASWVRLMYIGNVLFLYFYWRNLYYFLIRPEEYLETTLENLASYGNFLAFYFMSSAIYGFQVFIGVETWILMLVLMIATALIVYQVMWANRIPEQAFLSYLLIICVLVLEVGWAASFLTLSFYILGLILAVTYYVVIGLVRFYLLGSLNARVAKMYLAFGLGSILIVLFTANWISHN